MSSVDEVVGVTTELDDDPPPQFPDGNFEEADEEEYDDHNYDQHLSTSQEMDNLLNDAMSSEDDDEHGYSPALNTSAAKFFVAPAALTPIQEDQDSKSRRSMSARSVSNRSTGSADFDSQDQGGMTQPDLHLQIQTAAFREMFKVPELCVHANEGDEATLYSALSTAHPDTADAVGRTALFYTVINDAVNCAELLLSVGANVEARDVDGRSVVHWAAFHKSPKVLKALFEFKADPIPKDSQGRTPLHWCTVNSSGHKAMQVLLKRCTSKKIDVSGTDTEQMTPLHWAAFHNSPKHCEMLLKAGAKLALVDKEGKTALHWAAGNDDPSCAKVLSKFDKSVVNARDESLRTPLHMAVAAARPKVVEILLKVSSCDVNPQDNTGRTPLHWAAAMNNVECIKLLVAAHANPRILDKEGASAIHYACQHNHIEAIKALITSSTSTAKLSSSSRSSFSGSRSFNMRKGEKLTDTDANLPPIVDTVDINGSTPLMWAAGRANHEAMAVLLQAGADIDKPDNSGRTVLHATVYNSDVQSSELLLANNADTSRADSNGQTPLFVACHEGLMPLAELLLGHGCDVRTRDVEGRTCGHWAVISGHLEVAQLLLQQDNGIVELLDERGETLIHYAAFFGHQEIAVMLLAFTSADLMDHDGITPLHWAALKGHVEIARAFLEADAYPNFMEINGNKSTPYEYAINGGNTECAELIALYGGVDYPTMQHFASIMIQSSWRGYIARREYANIKQEKAAREEKRNKAATTLAATYKGHLARKQYRIVLDENENDKQTRLANQVASKVQEREHKQEAVKVVSSEQEERRKSEIIELETGLGQREDEVQQTSPIAAPSQVQQKKNEVYSAALEREERTAKALKEAEKLEKKKAALQKIADEKRQTVSNELAERSDVKPAKLVPVDPPPIIKHLIVEAKQHAQQQQLEQLQEIEADRESVSDESQVPMQSDVQSTSILWRDREVRKFIINNEKQRVQAIREKVKAAKIIQRAWRNRPYPGRVMVRKTQTRRPHQPPQRSTNNKPSPRRPSYSRASPSPEPPTFDHGRVKPGGNLTRDMSSLENRKQLSSARNHLPPSSLALGLKPQPSQGRSRRFSSIQTIQKSRAIESSYPSGLLPAVKRPQKPKRRNSNRPSQRQHRKLVLPHIPRPEDVLAEDYKSDKTKRLEREIAALTIQLWWRKTKAEQHHRTHVIKEYPYGAAHANRVQQQQIKLVYGNQTRMGKNRSKTGSNRLEPPGSAPSKRFRLKTQVYRQHRVGNPRQHPGRQQSMPSIKVPRNIPSSHFVTTESAAHFLRQRPPSAPNSFSPSSTLVT